MGKANPEVGTLDGLVTKSVYLGIDRQKDRVSRIGDIGAAIKKYVEEENGYGDKFVNLSAMGSGQQCMKP